MSDFNVLTSNNTNNNKKTSHAARKGAQRDNTLPHNKNIIELLSLLKLFRNIEDKLQVSYVEAVTLAHLYVHYASKGTGLNCPQLHKLYNGGLGVPETMRIRIKRLHMRGYVEYFGQNRDKRRSWNYIPTQRVIAYLSRLQALSIPD